MAITFNHNDQVYVKDGELGIGTASPSEALHIYRNAASAEIRLQNNTISSYIRSNTDNLNFYVSNGEKMRITSGGNVGIGTTTISGQEGAANGTPKLQVLKTGTTGSYDLVARFGTNQDENNSGASVLINSGNDRGLLISAGRASSNRAIAQFNLIQYDGNELTDGLTIYQPNPGSSGATSGTNVGIGTTSPSSKLHVNIPGNTVAFRASRNDGTDGDLEISFGSALTAYNSKASGHRWLENGSEKMRLNGGNLGIGTTSPSQTFTIEKNSSIFRVNTSTSTYPRIEIGSTSGTTAAIFNRTTASQNIIFGETTDTGNYSFRGGNVGIGTASPAYKLDVNGTAHYTGNVLLDDNVELRLGTSSDFKAGHTGSYTYMYNYTGHMYFRNFADDSDIIFQTDNGSGGYTNYLVLDGSSTNAYFSNPGNVGIGTTSPSKKLEVYSLVNTESSIRIRQASYNFWDLKSPASDTGFAISDVGGEKMRITSGGNVGIGTTSPSKKLHISDDNDAPLRVESTDPTTGIEFKDNSNSSQLYYVGGSDHFYIPSGTSLGVGAASPTLDSMLRVYSNQTTANENVYGSYFDFNTTGSDTLTANRTQAAVYVDADSSTTGGSTASGTEHRFYGIYSDTRASGDSDYIGGITTRAEANATSGQVTNTRGGEFIAVSDGNNSAATHSNITGTFSAAYAEDAAAINSLMGGWSYAYVNSNRTTNVTTLTGHFSEVEINADNTYTTAYLYRGTLDINSTHTITDTYAFRYDIYGTSAATNNWGIFIDDVDKNYLSGKVGIGTTSPNAMMHVTNSIQVDGGDTFGIDNSGHQIYMSAGGQGLGGEFGSGYARNLIRSDGSATIQIGDNTSLISLIKVQAGSGSVNGVVSFLTKNAERMRVHHNGNIGIGTTTPSHKLDVNGDIAVKGASIINRASAALVIGDIAGTDSVTNLTLTTAGRNTEVFLDDSGNVGINDTTPSYALDVTGTIRATGDVIAYSDARVKENVETIPNALDKVKSMRGVGYNKIGEEKRSIGVIAQEMLDVIPEVVHTDDQGMHSVAYGNLVGVLIEAMKEQQQQIEELKAIIDGITK